MINKDAVAPPTLTARVKPLLYVVTPVMRDNNLSAIGGNLRIVCDAFNLRWLPVLYGAGGNADAAGKRNIALEMIVEPGWVYHLDDDNLIHPNFPGSLTRAIDAHPDAKIFLFPQVRSDGSWFMRRPTIRRFRVDTGSYVVHSTLSRWARWSSADMPTPDYWWIKRICDQGYEPVFVDDGLCYYNALS